MRIIEKRPVSAEIENLDLRKVTATEVEELKMLLAIHGMLAFRNQCCNDQEFVHFLTQMGKLTFTVGETPVEGHPNLNEVSNIGRKTTPKSRFHIDSSYYSKPPAYSALRAVTLPRCGGETLFTNQYWAYETLSNNIRHKLENKTIKHQVTGVDLSDNENAETQADHPVFTVHPISGRTALYMSTPQRCAIINGLDTKQSSELISACYAHSIQGQNIYRHNWKMGDVIIWDNGCTLHSADHSNVDGDRVLHRGLSLGYNS